MNTPTIRHCLFGLVASFLVAWAAGALLFDTIQVYEFSPMVDRWTLKPGITTRHRSEGFASSQVGELGIRGLPGGKLPIGPKVVFWGDSFVEGVQVDDGERMAQAFTQMASQEGLALVGVGVGSGGDLLADSLFRVRDFLPALSPVTANVFVVSRIRDTLPGNLRPCRSGFLADPELRLERVVCPPSGRSRGLASAMHEFELAAIAKSYAKLEMLQLRFRPGLPPQPLARTTAETPPMDEAAAWNFLLEHMATWSGAPPVIVYLPPFPALRGGAVSLDDPDERTVRAFAWACQEHGIRFVHMGPTFVSHFLSTGRMVRGFFNSPPGTGHLNQDGHRLVAKSVLAVLKESSNAILAP